MTAALTRAWEGVRWYLKEFTGEARWDDYLAHCTEHGHTPMSRYEFERQRTDAAEKNPISRQHFVPRSLHTSIDIPHSILKAMKWASLSTLIQHNDNTAEAKAQRPHVTIGPSH